MRSASVLLNRVALLSLRVGARGVTRHLDEFARVGAFIQLAAQESEMVFFERASAVIAMPIYHGRSHHRVSAAGTADTY